MSSTSIPSVERNIKRFAPVFSDFIGRGGSSVNYTVERDNQNFMDFELAPRHRFQTQQKMFWKHALLVITQTPQTLLTQLNPQ